MKLYSDWLRYWGGGQFSYEGEAQSALLPASETGSIKPRILVLYIFTLDSMRE